ncbi:MAG: hypothetical protein PHO26_08595 [Dehalococcoidia bacterium]|nr:hypothetical protein [Dehalococcoidia bacterium]MDD5493999.1 hypothetical protein [Dehalococcoidia bacterium]
MRSWFIITAVCTIAILIGCQSTANGTPVSLNNVNQNVNGLTLNVTQPLDESVVRVSPVTVSGSTAAGSEVTINGLSVSLEDTHFSAQVELEEGPNSIEIIARNSSGKQASKYLTVVYVP